jgi:hypothetical protein
VPRQLATRFKLGIRGRCLARFFTWEAILHPSPPLRLTFVNRAGELGCIYIRTRLPNSGELLVLGVGASQPKAMPHNPSSVQIRPSPRRQQLPHFDRSSRSRCHDDPYAASVDPLTRRLRTRPAARQSPRRAHTAGRGCPRCTARRACHHRKHNRVVAPPLEVANTRSIGSLSERQGDRTRVCGEKTVFYRAAPEPPLESPQGRPDRSPNRQPPAHPAISAQLPLHRCISQRSRADSRISALVGRRRPAAKLAPLEAK